MTRKTKATLAALLVAAFVTPAVAQAKPYNGSHRAAYATSQQRVIEGRNAAGFSNFGAFNSAPSGRDAMVQSLGN
jgi:hypothetical protein